MRKITSLLMLLCVFVGTAWAEVSPELKDKYASIGEAANEVAVDQWYVLVSHGRNSCVSEETSAFKMRQIPSDAPAESLTGKLFKITAAAEAGQYHIQSGNGLYFDFKANNTSSVSETPVAYSIKTIGENAGHFYIQHVDSAFIADGQEQGNNFVCWGKDVPTNNGGNNCYHLLPVTLKYVVSVTYNYYINGKLYTSQVKIQELNSNVEVPAQAFLTVVNYEGTIGEEDCEITVNCTENLPFAVTTDLSNPVWQVVEMHRNSTFRVWDYVGNDVDVKVTEMSSNKEGVSDDSKLWCFTGNLIDGFKIYNKKAGTSVTLNATSGTAKVGNAENGNDVWKLKKSTQTNDPAACFTNDGSNYMNQNGGIIKYHNQPDNGSTNYFYAPADIVLQEASLLDKIPAGAVGALIDEELVSGIREAAEDAIANPTNIEKVQTLSNLLSQSRESEKVEMTAGYYFVKGTGNGNNESWYITHKINNDKECLWAADAPASGLTADYVWKFETADDGYKMQCTNLNAYFNLKTATNGGDNNTYLTETAGDAKILKLEDKGLARYVIKDTASIVLRSEASGQLNYWNGEANETWYIIPATELDITVGEAGWGTIYLPFDVTVPNTVNAYAVTGTNSEWATLTEMGDIRANQGAVLEGAGTHTFTIATANSDWSQNLLTGTTVNTYTYVEDNKIAYVLAKEEEEGIGFYKAKLNKDGTGADGKTHFLNNANKAYLVVEGSSGARFLSFDFGNETAIDELKGENGNVKTVIYDLAGRRVQKAQKGLYIVNGAKVIK